MTTLSNTPRHVEVIVDLRRTTTQIINPKRWIANTAFLTIKHRFGPAVHPRAWYNESHELVLTAIVYSLEQALNKAKQVYSPSSLYKDMCHGWLPG
jgi:hypothetical protein